MTMRRESRTTMNRALDEELDQRERAAFHAHLNNEPAEADQWTRLRRVDQTLDSAAMLKAPDRFADRVLSALTKRLPTGFDFQRGTGFALGLYTSMVISVTVLAGGLFGLIQLWNSGTVITAIAAARTGVSQLWDALQNAIAHISNAPILAAAAAFVTIGALSLAKLAALPSPTETYQIPVQFSL